VVYLTCSCIFWIWENNLKTFISENKNKILKMDGIKLLSEVQENCIDACFFDPQYRQVLEKMKYGNEGARQKGRVLLKQMPEDIILKFLAGITLSLKPSGHLFLWIDKFILCEGNHTIWFEEINWNGLEMNLVDMISWNKGLMGMGYRSRRMNEHLLIYQKTPKTTKNWTDKSIPDDYSERIPSPRTKGLHPHRKPIGLTTRLINAVVPKDGIVLDPCAGSFSTFISAKNAGRDFIGCDLTLKYVDEELL